jgi:hypothetical protein
MTPVPRIGRLIDLAGLLLFAIGAAVFVRAWIGFRGMVGYEPPVAGTTAVEIADGFWRLQKIGAGLMFVGMFVFIVAWWTARITVSRSDAPAGTSS